MIQLLPVNDTSVYDMWWDSYPYSSVSVRHLSRTSHPSSAHSRLQSACAAVCVCAHSSSAFPAPCQVFALHPLYLSVSALCPGGVPADIAQSIEDARAELDQEQVDYERTLELKLGLARRIFDRSGSADIKASPPWTPSVASNAWACFHCPILAAVFFSPLS